MICTLQHFLLKNGGTAHRYWQSGLIGAALTSLLQWTQGILGDNSLYN